MKEVPRTKRMEVALLYLTGNTYRQVEEETGVSHGSVANIIRELEEGALTIPGIASDEVDDLHQLALGIRSSGLTTSQALLGLRFFQELRALEITPVDIQLWSRLVHELKPPGFPVKEFLDSAMRLHQLEVTQGKSFGALIRKYTNCQTEADKLQGLIGSLNKHKSELTGETKQLSKKLDDMKLQKRKLTGEIEMQMSKLEELTSRLRDVDKEVSSLRYETHQLRKRKTALSSEVDAKEELLGRLSEMGFSEEELFRVKGFIERISEKSSGELSQVRADFFSALSLYSDISDLKLKIDSEKSRVEELSKRKSMLNGEIAGLETRKQLLLGEIGGAVTSTSERLKGLGEEAASQLQEHLKTINQQFHNLLAEVLVTGQGIGQMNRMVKEGEAAEKSLKEFIAEVKAKVGGK
jgi:methyl-accepting chemotaxis protein